MPFLLLMLLAGIALFITLVGYLLSSRNSTQPRKQRTANEMDYYTRGERRLREPLAERRIVAYTEQGLWVGVWQALLVSVDRMFKRRAGEPAPWAGIIIIFVTLLLLSLFLLKTLLPNNSLIAAITTWPLSPSNAQSSSSSQHNPQGPQGPFIASQSLERLSQLDPAQYNSSAEYSLWAYSACSSAAMTEVINAYGHHYRVTDILKVEAQIHEITPELGLLEDAGIEHTVARFGFKTVWGHNMSLDDIIGIANRGEPVIVSFPPYKYAGGHLLVVTGGSGNYVYLADSSLWNRHSLTREQFLQWWGGFAAIVTPK